MRSVDPPGLSAWLVACASSGDEGVLTGDLEEEFRTAVLPRLGRRGARHWYRKQAAASVTWLVLYGARDRVGAFVSAVIALLSWQLIAYSVLSLGLATERPLAEMSALAFTLIWVFGGALAAGVVGAHFRPRRASGTVALVGLMGVALLILSVDEPVGLGYSQSWAAAALVGAFLGDVLGRRLLPARPLA